MASLEVASGAFSMFPGAGKIGSFSMDGLIATLDVTDAYILYVMVVPQIDLHL